MFHVLLFHAWLSIKQLVKHHELFIPYHCRYRFSYCIKVVITNNGDPSYEVVTWVKSSSRVNLFVRYRVRINHRIVKMIWSRFRFFSRRDTIFWQLNDDLIWFDLFSSLSGLSKNKPVAFITDRFILFSCVGCPDRKLLPPSDNAVFSSGSCWHVISHHACSPSILLYCPNFFSSCLYLTYLLYFYLLYCVPAPPIQVCADSVRFIPGARGTVSPNFSRFFSWWFTDISITTLSVWWLPQIRKPLRRSDDLRPKQTSWIHLSIIWRFILIFWLGFIFFFWWVWNRFNFMKLNSIHTGVVATFPKTIEVLNLWCLPYSFLLCIFNCFSEINITWRQDNVSGWRWISCIGLSVAAARECWSVKAWQCWGRVIFGDCYGVYRSESWSEVCTGSTICC